MASLKKISKERRGNRDKKKVERRQKALRREIAEKHATFLRIFGPVLEQKEA